MKDNLNNLKEYINKNITYNRYKERQDIYYDDYEKKVIEHCEDVEKTINELEALYELAKQYKEDIEYWKNRYDNLMKMSGVE